MPALGADSHHCPALRQNHIPVLSPALTDGSLGDMIFFHSYKNPGLVLDIVEGEALGPEEQGRRAGWAQGLTTALFPRPEAHQHPGHLCQALGHDHPGRGSGQAPHRQCQPHGKQGRAPGP